MYAWWQSEINTEKYVVIYMFHMLMNSRDCTLAEYVLRESGSTSSRVTPFHSVTVSEKKAFFNTYL